MYSEKVMDHFQNPRNVGEIEDASGVGTVGNAKCGDIMRMFLDIDENGIIREAKFKTFGCGAAVATSSMATELVKGKTIQEALQVTNKAVMEALDGLPPVKVHCSLLAEEAIHAALWDYAEKNGIKIAVVGSGPAGLSFAGDMAKRGYDVTVFEALHEIGGVLKYGIPEFRLPNKIVDVEIDGLRKMGVQFEKDCIVGKTISYDDLHADGFKGVFVASGAGLPNFMNIPGENFVGVMSSNEYLTRVNLMDAANPESDTPVLQGKKVAVIGGGNTAMDSVRTARRLGAKRAMIVYRRSEEEMPARLEEVKHAKEEGVEFLTLHNPIEYIGDERGRVKQMRLQKMELGEADASGRRRPVPIEGAIETIDVDEVIVSVGVSPNPLIPRAFGGLEVSKKGTIVVEEDSMRSALGDVYAGGDIVRGGATVILAMGDGRKAAAAMDADLRG